MRRFAIALIACCPGIGFANATGTDGNGEISVGRYSFVENVATTAQLNPLDVVIYTKIPNSAKSIKEAIDFLLARSGYRLAPNNALNPAAKILLSKPLPAVHRKLGPMTLNKALFTLAGKPYSVLVDPVNRVISFDLTDASPTQE